MFKALAGADRRKILDLLPNTPMSTGDLPRQLPLLDRAHVLLVPLRRRGDRALVAQLQPLFSMERQLLRSELPTSRMAVVVEGDLSVTLEADGNGIGNVVAPAIGLRINVVELHLDAAEPVAHTAPAVAPG